jgi:hypothetical protein
MLVGGASAVITCRGNAIRECVTMFALPVTSQQLSHETPVQENGPLRWPNGTTYIRVSNCGRTKVTSSLLYSRACETEQPVGKVLPVPSDRYLYP